MSLSLLSLLREADNVLSNKDNYLMPYMHCDVAETKDAFIIHADVPGVSRDDIDVSVDRNVLTIQAARKKMNVSSSQPEEESKKTEGHGSSSFHIHERAAGKVSRSFELPSNVDFDSASSALENGVLTVTVKKMPEPAPRKILIQ